MMARFLIIFFVAISLTVGGVFAVNAFLDANADWSYLSGRASKPPIDPNNYAEAKYKSALLSSLPRGVVKLGVFGNSRATAIDVSIFKASEEEVALNLAFGGGTLEQIEVFLHTASEQHPGIVPLIGFNYSNCLSGKEANFLYLRPSPDFPAIMDSILRLGTISMLYRGVWASVSPRALSEVEILPDGSTIRHFDYTEISKIEEAIEFDRTIYLRSFKSEPQEYCYEVLWRLREVYPHAIFFLNPISRSMLDWIEEAGAGHHRRIFLLRIADFGPVLDFTCSREITDEISNYRDAHHYNRKVGQLVSSDLLKVIQGGHPSYACIIN